MATLSHTFQMVMESKPTNVNLAQVINALSCQPRKILNLPSFKIEVGAKVSLVCYQLNNSNTILNTGSKSANSPLIGKELKTKIEWVIHNNQIYTQA
jgi:dihydroorotase-like cyclic amidohydrolase